MELKEFIIKTISEITEGIVQSQNDLNGTGVIISPKYSRRLNGTHFIDNTAGSEQIYEVFFKVNVTVSDSNEGKAGIGVLGGVMNIGGQISSENSNQNFSSIEFSIPIVYPAGSNPERESII